MKKVIGRYQVTGRLAVRGHKPGSTFTELLHPEAEARLVARGNLTLLERVTITVHDLPHALPKGWLAP